LLALAFPDLSQKRRARGEYAGGWRAVVIADLEGAVVAL
jgi:hypothetical protein